MNRRGLFIRAYLRASTTEQDATRARSQLDAFAAERGLTIAASYVEHESGAKLARPELFRLLSDCRPGDVLLIEQVDRLSRLTTADWTKLRSEIEAKQVRIVALDLPTSWTLASHADEFTARMFGAINRMLLDVLAAVARKDYDDRRRRQAQGQAKAKEAGTCKGRIEDKARNEGIAAMLRAGRSYTDPVLDRMQPCDRCQDRQAGGVRCRHSSRHCRGLERSRHPDGAGAVWSAVQLSHSFRFRYRFRKLGIASRTGRN